MLISYGAERTIRYPKIKGNESSPNFIDLNKAQFNTISQIIEELPKSNQTLLSSAFELCKAILDDTDTVKPNRYKPILIIISSKTPVKGWEAPFHSLVNEGRSSNVQVFWIVVGNKEFKPPENCTFIAIDKKTLVKKPAHKFAAAKK